MRALVRRRQPRRAAAAQAHCTSAYALSTPEEASTVLPASRACARAATPTDPVAYEHPIARAQGRNGGRNRYRGARVQRLEVLVAVMLARERRAPADAAADGCTELAAALATLPSGVFAIVADAVAALGHADA